MASHEQGNIGKEEVHEGAINKQHIIITIYCTVLHLSYIQILHAHLNYIATNRKYIEKPLLFVATWREQNTINYDCLLTLNRSVSNCIR